jgi:para-nitrobenzyl esterase
MKALVAGGVLLVAAAVLPQAATDPTVQVSGGTIRGAVLAGGGAVFKGIPYAAPPVGDLRWREPQPVVPWADVRDATEFGRACTQLSRSYVPDWPTSEDCLLLHVWTPAWPALPKAPVMVWIHGGGNAFGNALHYGSVDGESLARRGVVVVSFNYRVGTLGFFSHPELTRESPHQASGNQGILDQIAALRWVQENIARFGGDPGNVTIFGESAGSLDVQVLLTTPRARGLFHRAIGESGSVMTAGDPRTLAAAERDGETLAKSWPIRGAVSLTAMRALPAEHVLVEGLGAGPNLGIVVDGHVFPEAPAAVFAAGKAAGVPLVLGSNAHDRISATKPEDLERSIGDVLGPLAPQARALYQGAPDPVHGTVEMQWDVDRTFRCLSVTQLVWHATAGHAAWQFEFARTMPGSRGPYHSAEVPYVFGTLRKPDVEKRRESSAAAFRLGQAAPNEIDDQVSEAMQAYWTNFAKRGDPNGPGLPTWPRFDPETRAYIQFTDAIPVAGEGLRRAACQLFVESLTEKFGSQ